MGLVALVKQWQAARKERRIEMLTAKAHHITEDKQYDLLYLYQEGVIRIRGTGQSITKVYADVENLIRKRLSVAISPGTYFVSSGGHQNMATTAKYIFTVGPCSTQHFDVNAACINADRPIPGKDDHFQGVSRVPDNVVRFLEASLSQDPMVIQAGVWTLTDNYSRYRVINHLIQKDHDGNTSHPITNEHCDKAQEILDTLGIPHHLWYSSVPSENKTEHYDNGSYDGEFRHGQKHGRGKYTWNDGNSYDGEWKNGKRNGQGVLTFEDGTHYIGEFRNDARHGRGKSTWKNGNSYDGEWDNERRHGQGILTFGDGGYYDGKFEYNRAVGGWYHHPNGTKDWRFTDAEGVLVPAVEAKPRNAPEHQSSEPTARSEARRDDWKFCVKCKKSDFFVQTLVQRQRWQAGICPYCEGTLINRAAYRKLRGS
jgi:hypothetical protein